MASTAPICLITGTSFGIGRALVDVALEAGAMVLAMGCTGREASDLLHEGEADVRDPGTLKGFFAKLPVERIDILINNAGVFPDPDVGLQELRVDNALDALDVNALGPLRVTRSCLSLLHRARSPRVLNISSNMGSLSATGSPGSYAYRMSKAALNMFTLTLSREFPSFRVLSVHPGWVRTRMGGPRAQVEPRASAEGIWRLATNPPAQGLSYDYLGRPLEW